MITLEAGIEIDVVVAKFSKPTTIFRTDRVSVAVGARDPDCLRSQERRVGKKGRC